MAQQQQNPEAIDPNIRAILAGHQQQLDLVARQYQHQAQREDAKQRIKIKDRFINEQKNLITQCDGSSLRAVREWLRQIAAAQFRGPVGQECG